MKRRNFIKSSGLLTGGLLFSGQAMKTFALPAEEKISVGIIGCGDRGKGIMHVLKQMNDQFKVTAICDTLDLRLGQARAIDKSAALKEFKDYRKLVEDKSIQLVVIATPLYLHYPIAVAALDAGKHVYLEKTMTFNIPQAISLVKKAKAHPQQVLQVGHQYRYTPMCFKIKEMVEKGYLGDITQIDCRWDRNGSWRRPVPAGCTDEQINWRMYKKYSGGIPAELLSHQMDFVNWVFNTRPSEIFATGGIDHYKDGRETYDNVQVMLRYEKAGMVGNFGATCGNSHDGYLFKLKGTKGMVQMLMDDAVFFPEPSTKKELETVDGVTGATKLEWNKDGGIPIVTERQKDGTWYALQDMYKCITEKKQPASNVITGATTAICVHMANEALFSHTIQKWKPAYNFS